MTKLPMAFLSYVNADDEHEGGRLGQFREMLSGEVRMLTGRPFPIFQDRADLKWGQNWQQRIDQSLDGATFLIPVITPGFFFSEACRDELSRFLKREEALGRSDLVLPLYYVDCPALNDATKRAADALVQAINAHQYADWRELRFEPFTSPVLHRKMYQLAVQIRDALDSAVREPSPPFSIFGADITPTSLSDQHIESESTGEKSLQQRVKADPSKLKPRFDSPGSRSGLSLDLKRVSWDLPSGKTGVLTHGGSVSALAISADGHLLASGGGRRDTYKTIRVWQISTGTQISEMEHFCLSSRQHYKGEIVGINFSSDGRTLASVGGMQLHLWSVSTAKEIGKVEYEHYYIKTSSGDIKLFQKYAGYDALYYADYIGMVVTARYNGVEIWRQKGKEPLGVKQEIRSGVYIKTVALSIDGRFLAVGGQQTEQSNNTLIIYDLSSNKLICEPALCGCVKCIEFSPDTSLLAVGGERLLDWEGGYSDTLKLWDPKSGREMCTLSGHDGGVSSLAFSPDGSYLVASGNGTTTLWNIADNKLVNKTSNFGGMVTFTTSGRLMVASVDWEGKIKVWQ